MEGMEMMKCINLSENDTINHTINAMRICAETAALFTLSNSVHIGTVKIARDVV